MSHLQTEPMTISDGKKRFILTLDVEVVERFDALCRERRQHRGHAVEAILRRSLARLGKSPSKPPPDPRQLDSEDRIGPPSSPSPADEPGPRAGSAVAREGSRTMPQAQTFERD